MGLKGHASEAARGQGAGSMERAASAYVRVQRIPLRHCIHGYESTSQQGHDHDPHETLDILARQLQFLRSQIPGLVQTHACQIVLMQRMVASQHSQTIQACGSQPHWLISDANGTQSMVPHMAQLRNQLQQKRNSVEQWALILTKARTLSVITHFSSQAARQNSVNITMTSRPSTLSSCSPVTNKWNNSCGKIKNASAQVKPGPNCSRHNTHLMS